MLLSNLNLLATAPGGAARLRELILTLAVQGKLVAQDAGDEPASELLKQIRAEKDRLIAGGKIKKDKPLAAISEEETPFELPVGWEWVRFGDASINRDGERIPVSSSDRDNLAKTYDYYGASGVIDKIDGFLFDKSLLLIGEDGANLINRSTPIAFLAHGKYWVNNHAHVIDTTHPELMTYLALFINAISLEPYVTGTAQPKMNQAKLNSIVIALPPLAEQSRIVTRVEELMRLCDALESKGRLEAAQHAQLVSTLLGTLTESDTPEQLAENWQRLATHFDLLLDRPQAVDALEQTILQLAVRGLLVPQDPMDEPASQLLRRVNQLKAANVRKTPKSTTEELPLAPYELPTRWTWAQLGELVENMGSGWSPACDEGERSDPTHWAVLRTTAVQINEFRAREHKVIPSKLSPRPEIEVKDGDILITRAGPMNRVGISCWVDNTPPRLMLSDKIVRFHSVAEEMLPAFIVLALNAGWTKEQIDAAKSGMAASQVNISQSDLRGFWIPVCSKAEQSRIVTRVAQLRHLCADLRQRLAASQSNQAQLAEALVQQPSSDVMAEAA